VPPNQTTQVQTNSSLLNIATSFKVSVVSVSFSSAPSWILAGPRTSGKALKKPNQLSAERQSSPRCLLFEIWGNYAHDPHGSPHSRGPHRQNRGIIRVMQQLSTFLRILRCDLLWFQDICRFIAHPLYFKHCIQRIARGFSLWASGCILIDGGAGKALKRYHNANPAIKHDTCKAKPCENHPSLHGGKFTVEQMEVAAAVVLL